MLLDRSHARWAAGSGLVALGAGIHYAHYAASSPHGPVESSAQGLAYGIAAALLVVFAASLSLRRMVPGWRIGAGTLWLKAHIWLSLLIVPLAFFHSGMSLGSGTLTRVLMVLLLVIETSGLFGLAMQHLIPQRMARRCVHEVPYPLIDDSLGDLAREALARVLAILDALPTEHRAALAPVAPGLLQLVPAGLAVALSPAGASGTSGADVTSGASRPAGTAGAAEISPTAAPDVPGASSASHPAPTSPLRSVSASPPAPTPPSRSVSTSPASPTSPTSPTASAPSSSPASPAGSASGSRSTSSAADAPKATTARRTSGRSSGKRSPGPRETPGSPSAADASGAAGEPAPIGSGVRHELYPLVDLYLHHVRPYLAGEPSSLEVPGGLDRTFAQARLRLPVRVHPSVDALGSLCEEREQLVTQRQLHRWLHYWLMVHAPLAMALVVLVAVHAVQALRY